MQNYDIVIIGSGPSGYSAACALRDRGLSVCVIEKSDTGGVCLNRGCIPTKVMVSAARRYEEIKASKRYGISFENPGFVFSEFKRFQSSVVTRLRKSIENSIEDKGIIFYKAKAYIKDKNVIILKDSKDQDVEIGYSKLIIATGTKPIVPKIWQDIGGVASAEDVWQLEELPKDILIVGGGVIGCEYASSLSSLGYNITLVEKQGNILTTEEPEISKACISELKKKGVKLLLGCEIGQIRETYDRLLVSVATEQLKVSLVICCMGRVSVTEDLGLQNLGISDTYKSFEPNSLKICDNVWAIGDAADGPALAHKGYYDAELAAREILGEDIEIDYSNIPIAIYTHPEISRVGLTEHEAKREYDVASVVINFPEIGKAVAENARKGFLKMNIDNDNGKILGISIFGHEACELQGYSCLIINNKMSASDLAGIHFAHPTIGEIFKKAGKRFLES